MQKNKAVRIYQEGVLLLFESAKRAAPFNIIIAFLLAIDLILNGLPWVLAVSWLCVVTMLGSMRWMFCKHFINKTFSEKRIHCTLAIFTFLSFLTGLTWGLVYFISLHYIPVMHEFIIILVFGGLSAGAVASLSIYLPAYYAYVLSMILPLIIYNYALFNVDRMILATMFILFVTMLIIVAHLNKNIFTRMFRLSAEKEKLLLSLKIISITDSLTGLYNRRYFEKTLEEELSRAIRNRYPVNLISIDVDNFKLINDNFGHPTGDEFIKYIAKLLESFMRRSNDIVFRVGGDEFAAILVNLSLKEALLLCERIKQFFSKHDLPERIQELVHDSALLSQVSLSMGVIHIPYDYTSSLEDVRVLADDALYQAKAEGKNKIIYKEIK